MSESNGSTPRPPATSDTPRSGVSRRFFVQTLGAGAAVSGVGTAAEAWVNKTFPARAGDDVEVIGPGPAPITLTVNGNAVKLSIEPSTTLLDALRLHANLTGSKEVCDRGSCGACSVLVDGKLTVSCMMLAVDAVGTSITTVEGLALGDELDPVQKAFVKHDALQCGFCTPGLVMACKAVLNEHPKPTLEQIKHGLSGNICRCGTYTNVFNAALEASGQEPVRDSAKP
ncbi:MAG: (2Fe-2S)-binding protein [Phycisphaerales bacterium]